MKVAQRYNRVHMDGQAEEHDFSIKASPKAFHILSNLYSDIIAAVIREYSTNAADSHIQVGHEQPFDVHLPTMHEPHFSVRDYGSGLSLDEMRLTYIVMFESTRENSNDHIGCLGLGSKSAFAYTDNFVIESWKNGEYNICNMYKGEDGIPRMRVMASSQSDKPDGVKITVNVKDGDVYEWQRKAKSVYSYFKVLPNFIGANIKVDTPEYVLEDDGWRIRSRSIYGDNHARAVMGNIAYPIRLNDSSIDSKIVKLLSTNIDVDFGIGELEIDPSREGLIFDKRTVNNINKRFNRILSRLEDRVKEYFKECDCLWDARCLYQSITNSIPYEIINVMPASSFQWNGQNIVNNNNYGYVPSRQVNIKKNTDNHFQFERKWDGKSTRNIVATVTPSDNIIFFEKDMKTGSQVRLREFVENHSDKVKAVLLSFKDDTQRKEWMDRVGVLERHMRKTSSLPKPVPQVRNKQTRNKLDKVSKYVPSGYVTKSWQNASKDLSTGGVYVEVNRYKIKKDGGFIHPNIIENVQNYLTVLGYGKVEVWGIKSSLIDKVEGIKGWTNFFDDAKSKLSKYLKKNDVGKILSLRDEFDNLNAEVRFALDQNFEQFLDNANPGTTLGDFADDYFECVSELDIKKSKSEVVERLYRDLYNKKFNYKSFSLKNQDRWRRIVAKSPLINHLPRRLILSSNEYENLVNYINFCLGEK